MVKFFSCTSNNNKNAQRFLYQVQVQMNKIKRFDINRAVCSARRCSLRAQRGRRHCCRLPHCCFQTYHHQLWHHRAKYGAGCRRADFPHLPSPSEQSGQNRPKPTSIRCLQRCQLGWPVSSCGGCFFLHEGRRHHMSSRLRLSREGWSKHSEQDCWLPEYSHPLMVMSHAERCQANSGWMVSLGRVGRHWPTHGEARSVVLCRPRQCHHYWAYWVWMQPCRASRLFDECRWCRAWYRWDQRRDPDRQLRSKT
jgi:hypothetical protein